MTIESGRLQLVPMTPAFLEACLAADFPAASKIIGLDIPDGWEIKHSTFERRLLQLREDATFQLWSLRAIAIRGEKVLLGQIGFHAAPGAECLLEYAPGGIEIGYSVSPAYQQRGYATEACMSLIGWARQTAQVPSFVLSISPTNEPSLRIARSLGFKKVGSHVDDEDGPEDIFVRHFNHLG